jgi:GT2 family glycosyltransferase
MIKAVARRCLSFAGGLYARFMSLNRRVLRLGMSQLRLGRKTFDADWYLEQNPDVVSFKGHIANHFFRHGIHEGRKARFFDDAWYFRAHDDLSPFINAWSHYRKYGRDEGRAARFIHVESVLEKAQERSYKDWLRIFERNRRADLRAVESLSAMGPHAISFAVVLVMDAGASATDAAEVLKALKAQIYDRVTIYAGLMPDTAPDVRDLMLKTVDDKRFKISELPVGLSRGAARNRLAALSEDTYIVSIGAADRLDATAFYWMNEAAVDRPAVLFSDEDRLNAQSARVDPSFKPQFNYELFLTHNMLGAFTLYRRDVFEEVQGYAEDLDSALDYDLAFRVYEQTGSAGFERVPRMLNHVTAPRADATEQTEAVARHLKRIGKTAEVVKMKELTGYNRVRFDLPHDLPLVSIIIPTRDRVELLRMCLTSLEEQTTYSHYEVIIIDNGSVEKRTLDYFATLPKERFRVVRDDQPFNYSALNNHGVRLAKGEFICMMNNDIELITPDWLEEMLSFAIQPDVGCVGARLWYPDDRLQHAGVLIGFHGVAGHMHKMLKRGETGYADRAALPQSLSAVTAALLLVRKSLYEEMGGFDEALAVAFNDVDFCLRVRNAGYRNVYTPFAEAYHHESASRGGETTPEKRAREQLEIDLIKARYGESLLDDPAFNPNLSLTSEDIAFANPSRVKTASQILREKRRATKSSI